MGAPEPPTRTPAIRRSSTARARHERLIGANIGFGSKGAQRADSSAFVRLRRIRVGAAPALARLPLCLPGCPYACPDDGFRLRIASACAMTAAGTSCNARW
jgi:hypothetical protein